MNNNLEIERGIFNKNFDEWLKTNPQKFVLIKENNVLGFYKTLDEAFIEGTKKFGLEDFFIEQIIQPNTTNILFMGKYFFMPSPHGI